MPQSTSIVVRSYLSSTRCSIRNTRRSIRSLPRIRSNSTGPLDTLGDSPYHHSYGVEAAVDTALALEEGSVPAVEVGHMPIGPSQQNMAQGRSGLGLRHTGWGY